MFSADIRRKAFPSPAGEHVVIEDFSLNLGAGEIVALVGPSGCGKSTLLRLISGLDTDYSGRVDWPAGAPRIGTIFQEPRLLPWRTVRQNLRLVVPPDRAQIADALLERLGLAAFADAYPQALSLGMARRVALARALAIDPDLLLLDEPFASLDPESAERCRALLLESWSQRPVAALLVTHDFAEAATLADRVLLLAAGPMRIAAERVVPALRRQRRAAT